MSVSSPAICGGGAAGPAQRDRREGTGRSGSLPAYPALRRTTEPCNPPRPFLREKRTLPAPPGPAPSHRRLPQHQAQAEASAPRRRHVRRGVRWESEAPPRQLPGLQLPAAPAAPSGSTPPQGLQLPAVPSGSTAPQSLPELHFPAAPAAQLALRCAQSPWSPTSLCPRMLPSENPTLNLYPYSSPSLSSCSALCPLSMAISISIFISSPLPMDVPIQEPNVEPLSVPHPSLTQYQPSPHRCSHPKPNTEPFPAENAHRPHLTHQHFPVKAQHGASLCFHVETKPSLQWGEVQMGWDEGTAAVAPTSVPTTPNGGSALPYGVTPNTTLPYIKERPPSSPPKHSTRHPLHASSYISDNK